MEAQNPALTAPIPLTRDGVTLVIVAVFFILFATALVALRFYSRHLRRVSPGWDDYTCLVALIAYYSYGVSILLDLFIAGLGHHVSELQPYQLSNGLKLVLFQQVIYGITLGLIKCSICLLLIRIFYTRRFRLAANIVIGASVAWTVMVILIALLICIPLEYQWNLNPTGGHCGDQNKAYAVVGALDILVDLLIFLLPMKELLRLQVPLTSKLALVVLFGLGVLTMIIGALRVVYIFAVDFSDASYSARKVFLWSIMEPGVGILVACGPTLRPPLEKIFKLAPILSSSSRNKSGKSSKPDPAEGDGFNRLIDSQAGNLPLQDIYGSHSEVLTHGYGDVNRRQASLEEGRKDVTIPVGSYPGAKADSEGINVRNEWSVLRH